MPDRARTLRGHVQTHPTGRDDDDRAYVQQRVHGRDPRVSAYCRWAGAINHADPQVDALIDRMREAATEEAFRQAGHDVQRYIAENMMIASIASVPFLQAARPQVQGYEHLHGFKIQFETTWLGK
jgi:ABC-type oligopeptide transport system substrate-binding subunit